MRSGRGIWLPEQVKADNAVMVGAMGVLYADVRGVDVFDEDIPVDQRVMLVVEVELDV